MQSLKNKIDLKDNLESSHSALEVRNSPTAGEIRTDDVRINQLAVSIEMFTL